MKLNLNNFGKNLKLNKRDKKLKEISEDKMFIETIGILETCWNKSNKMYELFGVNILEYEESYYQVIENFIFLKYGNWKTELIMWYIFGRVDNEGKIHPLTVSFKDEDTEEEVLIKNASELWQFMIRLEKNKNKE
jgi:hypothetical protein